LDEKFSKEIEILREKNKKKKKIHGNLGNEKTSRT
jgi:hypothetical protein